MSMSESTPITAAELQSLNPATLIDHTLLAPVATAAQIDQLCEEAVEFDFASVCVAPQYVFRAANTLYGSDAKVATVVAFPWGYSTTRSKVQETSELVAAGADEIDMVMSLGLFLDGRADKVEEDIAQVVLAAAGRSVKVIIECCCLNDLQKRLAADLVMRSGADFVKTSTGFAASGAVIDDVRLLSATVAGRIGVKAAGGIRNLADCQAFIAAGATRIGTSAGVEIVSQWQAQQLGA